MGNLDCLSPSLARKVQEIGTILLYAIHEKPFIATKPSWRFSVAELGKVQMASLYDPSPAQIQATSRVDSG